MATGAWLISGDMRTIMNTPAATMVAAWMRAEIGVGPSIASASQVCRKNCADLPIAPMNSRIEITSSAGKLGAEQRVAVAGMRGDGGENAVEGDGVEDEISERDADREEQVTDAVDDHRLDRRRIGGRPVIPVVDEQIGDEADPFPAEEQLQQVVRRHQHQHREGEQRYIREEARRGLVMRHVADAVDMDHQRDGADHRHHHQRQHVLAQRSSPE